MIRSKMRMGILWAIVAMALHMWPGVVKPAHGQGSRKDDIVFNTRGVPLAGAFPLGEVRGGGPRTSFARPEERGGGGGGQSTGQ